MAEISDRVTQLEAQVKRLVNRVFEKEEREANKRRIHTQQQEEKEKIADQVRAINSDSSIDAKEKQRQIKDLEGISRASMESSTQ